MNDVHSSQSRKLSVCHLEFTKRIEDILKKIKRLENTKKLGKVRKGKQESIRLTNRDQGFPLLTYAKIPYRPCRDFSTRLSKPVVSIQARKLSLSSAACYTESDDCALKVSKFSLEHRMLSPDKERYNKILNLTQKMISKDELRGWSRN